MSLESLLLRSKFIEVCRKVELDASTPEVEFHKKYWGVGMEDERKRWVADNRELIDSQTNRMKLEDESASDDTFRVEEYVEGCFAMSALPFTNPPKLWVRAE